MSNLDKYKVVEVSIQDNKIQVYYPGGQGESSQTWHFTSAEEARFFIQKFHRVRNADLLDRFEQDNYNKT